MYWNLWLHDRHHDLAFKSSVQFAAHIIIANAAIAKQTVHRAPSKGKQRLRIASWWNLFVGGVIATYIFVTIITPESDVVQGLVLAPTTNTALKKREQPRDTHHTVATIRIVPMRLVPTKNVLLIRNWASPKVAIGIIGR